ncbi:DDE-type integrase/transposase/recombinase [Salinisphaera sp. P385]|uniref:DDE-type integrase/transposase/recombinase n=1 Tax=Spectribacter acetivorans TaxID=3075603 RepID=A0ABU3B767_9GAMM|nr:DDE-type integrase/transposase/recombinase [Salinisphaera sp. P385]MDT0618308.1 DDE-type integrase/transposase/recombinase [Salinisphaera sp. P385]
MAELRLERGAVIDFHGRRYTCGGRGPGGGYMLAPHKGRTNQLIKPGAAFDALAKGKLVFVKEESDHEGDPPPELHFDLTALAEGERTLVLMRHYYMRRMDDYRREGGKLSEKAVTALAREVHTDYVAICRRHDREPPHKPMSEAAVRRWYRRWVNSGHKLISIVRDATGNSHSKLTTEQADALYAAIHDDYMDRRRISARHAHTLMTAKLNIENRAREARGEAPIKIPHYNTLLAHLDRVDLFEKLKARYNTQYALKVTRQYGITPPAIRHLERVQVDHTLLDIYVDFGHRTLVRPWLTLILDSYSKAILGFWLTPDPASAESVMQAMRMAILPKNVRELGGDAEWHWPMHGLPSELTLDNGKEFHGKDLEMAAAELGFTLNFTPPRKPWFKAQVERKFGEINRSLLAQLPGQVFKYEPEKHGLDYPHLSLDELKRIFLQWITTVLHRTPNENGHTPEQLWLESVHRHGMPGGGFAQEYVEMCLSKTCAERIIHPNGIHLNDLHFNNEWLSRLRNELAPKVDNRKPAVTVKWSAADVGVIYVLHPDTHEFFRVEAQQEYAHGRSLYNHRVVKREQRLRRKASLQDACYTDAALALDQAIKELTDTRVAKGKKLGTKVARYESGKPKRAARTCTPTPPEPFDREEPIQHLDDDVVNTSTGEILTAKPTEAKTPPSDKDIEDFADDLEI